MFVYLLLKCEPIVEDETLHLIMLRDEVWNVIGSSNQSGAGIGLYLVSPDGLIIEEIVWLLFPTTNNKTEYEAFIAGIRLAKNLCVTKIDICSDLDLVVSQWHGELFTKESRMKNYLNLARQLFVSFESFQISQIPRVKNSEADRLATLASGDMKTL